MYGGLGLFCSHSHKGSNCHTKQHQNHRTNVLLKSPATSQIRQGTYSGGRPLADANSEVATSRYGNRQ